MGERRALRRQRADHHFRLTDNAGCHSRRLPAGRLDSYDSAVILSQRGSDSLKADWQRHVLASPGYLELGMDADAFRSKCYTE